MNLKDSGDELMLTMSAFLSPIEPAGQDISPASHVPLPWRSGEPRADTGAKGSHVAADATHGKTHCLSMQPPASERRSAVCKAQSLVSSLIHTIPAPHQWLPCLEDTTLLFTRYQPPNSGLPCEEDTLSFRVIWDPRGAKDSPHLPVQKSVRRRGVN